MPLFCIIGPDGVGKTTQARLLEKKLKKTNINCKYVWFRFNHKFSLPLLFFSRVIGLTRVKQLKNGRKISYHYFNKLKPMAYIYSITLFVDTWLSVLTRIALPLLFKRTIICDRCVYDTLVDLAISVRNPVFKNLALRVFANMMPKGKVIMLKASVETLRKRRDDLLEDEDLELKVLLYEMLASKLNLIVLDSERTIKEVHEKIMGIYSINNTAIS